MTEKPGNLKPGADYCFRRRIRRRIPTPEISFKAAEGSGIEFSAMIGSDPVSGSEPYDSVMKIDSILPSFDENESLSLAAPSACAPVDTADATSNAATIIYADVVFMMWGDGAAAGGARFGGIATADRPGYLTTKECHRLKES
jgi:hypothetical protein